jgi:hypothetical protein
MFPTLQLAGARDQRDRPVIADSEIADPDVAWGGHVASYLAGWQIAGSSPAMTPLLCRHVRA